MECFDVVCPTCNNCFGDFNETEQNLDFLGENKVTYSFKAVCPKCGQKFIHHEIYNLYKAEILNIKLG